MLFDLVVEQEPFLEGLSSLEEVIESFFHLCFVANMEYPKVNTFSYIGVPELYGYSTTYESTDTQVSGSAVLRSRNYLFFAPAPTLTIISAPAPASAIYWHLKMF